MKRRSLILMIAIVLLPIALLTWFGVRMARDEQTLVQQRYRSLMEQRLQDVNRSIAQRFDETERRLQQITSVSDFDVTELRALIRREPQVTQLFVLSPEGELLYPNPAEPLNGTEQSFLRQASRMFTDRDLQNAVALAEAGTLEQRQLGNRPAQSQRSGASSRQMASSPSFSRSGDDIPFLGGSGGSSESARADAELQEPTLAMGGNSPLSAETDQLRQESGGEGNSAPLPLAETQKNDRDASMLVADAEPDEQAMRRAATPQFPVEPNAAPGFSAPASADAKQSEVANSAALDGISAGGQQRRQAPQEVASVRGRSEPPPAPSQMAAPAAAEPVTSLQDPFNVEASPQPPARSVESEMELRGGGLSPMNDASIDTMNAMAFQQNALEASEAGSYPESRGWFVWYWDRGMNLVYWQRRPSGHIVGAALERARWIADLISCLPESSDIVKDSATVDTAFRVVTSSVEPVYRWGADFALDGPPYCEIPLASPLASWRLQCFVPAAQLSGGRSTALFGMGSGIAAFALTLCGLAWFLYRDYARDMREASQQVSFVNQVSHELKTPLTNIRMYAELLERDLDQVSEEQSKKPLRRLEIINAEAQRLSRLIGNVLMFARQRKKTLQISPEKLDPVKLVESICERFQPSLEEKSIELRLEGDAGRVLMLDADFVEQILGNLISNVEKYAASGKLLNVRTTCSESQVTIDVIDAGPGIPAQYRSSVFEPFERLNNDLRASTGTGIGLSIARDLARLHGGDLLLMQADRGCWFQCRLASIDGSAAKQT